MLTAAWFLTACTIIAMLKACRERPRADGLDFVMVMRVAVVPKKPRGRAQQTKAHRRKKTRK